jgi:NAD(P)-dependent dehydrogenase (short-subunit alcohol dehydrogenase family)
MRRDPVASASRHDRSRNLVFPVLPELDSVFRLDDRTAVVTGGNRGIGRGIAEVLAAAGARVVLAARDVALLDEVRNGIELQGGQALAVSVDVARDADCRRLIDKACDTYGGVDILVNNAAAPRFSLAKSADAMPMEDYDLTMAVNLRAPYLLCQLAARAMIARGHGGSIINISSIAGAMGVGNYSAYSSSKGALDRLSESMAVDWGMHGIRVNSLGPGMVATDENRHLREDPVALARAMSTVPLGRPGQPHEIGRVVLFLASDAASFVTGQTLYVDGGAGPIRPGSGMAAGVDAAADSPSAPAE